MAELPFSAEYAKTGRASCKGCKEKIDQGTLRLAVMVQSAFFDGKQANWFHDECFFKKQRPKSTSDISNFNTLRNTDQKRIAESIEKYGSGVALPAAKGKGKGKKRGAGAVEGALKDFAVEYAKSSRATCRVCEIKICKDEVRISKTVFDTEIGQKYGGQALWHHVKCFAEERASLLYLAGGEDLPGFNTLSKEDKALVKAEIKALKGDDVPIKKLKSEPKDKEEVKIEKDLKKKMEAQNDLYFRYKDALEDYSLPDLKELIVANKQKVPSGSASCIALVVDSMAFGALDPCPKCKDGQLVLDTYGYKCSGDLTEWTKCQYVTQQPTRKPFKVPKQFNKKAPFLKFKGKVAERLFDAAPQPSTYIVKSESDLAAVKAERPPPPLKNLQFFIYGKTKTPKDQLKSKVLKLGGLVPTKLSDVTAAVISTQSEVDKMSNKMTEIQEKDIEVVDESFLDLIDKDKGTPGASLQLIKENNIASWGSDPLKRVPQDVVDGKSIPKSGSLYMKSGKSAPQKLKLKGGTAVDPDSGLADEVHVYKDSHGTKWSAVLGLTDIVSRKNSFYKLQILEGDVSKRYWLFRSWGRIGTTIGGNKTEPMTLDRAMEKFRELYLDKTENHWENRNIFQKMPGKMYPVDLDYGEQDDAIAKLEEDINCKLPLPVQRLIMTIFDINLMKRVLLEFELDTEKMPLGKLSKKQIKSGYEVLSQLLTYVEEGKKQGYMHQDNVVNASNRFYTLIPHSFGMDDPLLLSTEDRIKTKIEMLDNLLEIEIAYSLLKSESSSDQSPIEGHYAKLKAHIEPIDPSSPEFEMLLKYVKNTHGKTHSQYTLEIQQAFKVVREGEDKRYKPFKKLHNRRLLWHGSRTTNFAGILSQGLRIAPPEAPVTGYMFGKGIYFADMVSKSANYCCTSRNQPVGIMMLCEVALGDMKECMQSEYVTKLPPGKHSVWGRGRTMPDPDHDLVLDSGAIVPLGPPIEHPANFSLLYNEFIVYDVAQVNVQYLFEMKFNYKY